MAVTPDDVPADHAALLVVAGVVGAVEGEVPQRGELRLYAGRFQPVVATGSGSDSSWVRA